MAVWGQFSFRQFLFQLILLLKVYRPFQCLVNANHRVLICCTYHFQNASLFILASCVCKSLQCLISALTQGGEGSHLFRLTCSFVLWAGRNTANTHHWRVWGVLTVFRPHWVCPAHTTVLSWSTLLKLQVALQGNSPKQALGCMNFPSLSCSGSGSWVLHKGTDSVVSVFCVLFRSEQLR